MTTKKRLFYSPIAALIVLTLMLAFSFSNTHSVAAMGDENCEIPESGPWPPCATNGGGDHSGGSADECVIPDSGPWPPCATNGGGNSPAPAPGGGSDECVIPDSGPWPPCATNGGGNAPAPAPAPGGGDDCVIPDSGPWPPCANGGNAGNTPAPPVTNQPVPAAQVAARIDLALEQLQVYWQAELKAKGVNYRPPGTVQTYEGHPDDPPNAFYIPAFDSVFIDLRLLRELTADFGEYAAVAVLAHEWGHFIQDQLNRLSEARPLRRIELEADCFTGSFTQYLNNTGQLRDGEFESARALFYSIGDDIIAPDAPYNRPGAHGTAMERQNAFVLGFDTSAQQCIDSYE